MLKTKMEINL